MVCLCLSCPLNQALSPSPSCTAVHPVFSEDGLITEGPQYGFPKVIMWLTDLEGLALAAIQCDLVVGEFDELVFACPCLGRVVGLWVHSHRCFCRGSQTTSICYSQSGEEGVGLTASLGAEPCYSSHSYAHN